MSYKYPAVKQLARLIREGQVPPDIDLKAVFKKYNEYLLKPKKVVPKASWKPRFYDRAAACNYRANRLGAAGKVTHEDLENVFAAYGGKCAHCGTKENLVFNHIVPYFRGGTNVPSNLFVLCRICSMLKGAN